MDCEWNDWQFGECSVTCGGGQRIDTRTVQTEATCGGVCMPDDSERVVHCNTEACPRKAIITHNLKLSVKSFNSFHNFAVFNPK